MNGCPVLRGKEWRLRVAVKHGDIVLFVRLNNSNPLCINGIQSFEGVKYTEEVLCVSFQNY